MLGDGVKYLVRGLTALASSLNRVDLATSKLAISRASAVVGTTGSTASLATSCTSLLAGLDRVDLSTCELWRDVRSWES